MRLSLAFVLLSALLPVFASAGTFSACGTLSSGDYYTQTANITASTSPCVTVAASNTVLDCSFFALQGSGRPQYGVAINSGLSNVTVKNCQLLNHSASIKYNSNNVVVENNEFLNLSSYGSSFTSGFAICTTGSCGTDGDGIFVNANRFFAGGGVVTGMRINTAANVSNNTFFMETATTSFDLVTAGSNTGQYSTIRNNTVFQRGSTLPTFVSMSGSFVLIENNTVNSTTIGTSSATGASFTTNPAQSTIIRRNNFTGAGISLQAPSIALAGFATGTLVENNYIGGSFTLEAANVTVRNNTIQGFSASKPGFQMTGGGLGIVNTSVQSNVIRGPFQYAFQMTGGRTANSTLENNTIIGTGSETAVTTTAPCSDCIFASNALSSLGLGFQLQNTLPVTLRNNNITSTTTAFSLTNVTQYGPFRIERQRLNFTQVDTIVSVNATSAVSFSSVTPGSNADPTTGLLFKNISEYVSVSNDSAGSYWEIAVYYESTGRIGADSLRMYKRVGSNWHNVSDVGGFLAFQNVPSGKYVWVNVTNLSVFAPMGFGDTTRPKITNVSAVNQNDTSATITWNTDESSNTSVNYGTTLSLGTSSGVDDLATFHSRALYGLSASTTYFYNVTSCDSAGNCNTTGNSSQLPFNFTTLPSGSTGGSTDTDGDGLTDVEEVSIYGTNASAADTDGDGYLDGQEVAVGSNPLDALSYARVSVVKIAPVFEAWDLVLFFALATAILLYYLIFHGLGKKKRRRLSQLFQPRGRKSG